MVNRNRILSRDEVSRVLAYLAVWADRRESERLNRVIFRLSAGCGLRCLEIQAPGRRAMDTADFLNGHSLDEGHRFQS